MTTRRDFMAGAGALAGFGLAGCGTCVDARRSKARHATYWCTWSTQAETLKGHRLTGALKFPGDQGVPGVRDNMNEDVLFGPKGWANLFPGFRGDMVFMVDDGWDVPYGAKGGRDGIHTFGSLVPDRARFPSFGVDASDRDRLRAFVQRTEGFGWKGLGVWVACQAYRERFEAPLTLDALKEDLKRKLDEAAYAGVKYWKVDWGVHNFHVWYRRLMSEMKERYYPELVIDHCRGFNNAVNGAVDPYLKPASDKYRNIGTTGRIFGVPEYEPVTRDCEEIMSFSDVFRTYDSAHPLTTATMLERAAWELACADKTASRVVINTEDEPLIAAGLGLELSLMRASVWPGNPVRDIRPRQRRMSEDLRCIMWQRGVPAFGSDTPARVRYSDRSIREAWRFLPGECWFTGQQEIEYFQVAPACVTRGLPLPEVRGENGEVPYVVGSRHPDGALAFAALPLLDPVRQSYTPTAAVRFDAALEPDVPVAVFGTFGTLTLDDRTAGHRILARDILGGEAHDITGLCRRVAGCVELPGKAIAQVGGSQNPAGDDSEPGAFIEVCG